MIRFVSPGRLAAALAATALLPAAAPARAESLLYPGGTRTPDPQIETKDLRALESLLSTGSELDRDAAALKLGEIGGKQATPILIGKYRQAVVAPESFGRHARYLVKGLGLTRDPQARDFLLEELRRQEKAWPRESAVRAYPHGYDPDPTWSFIDALSRFLDREDRTVASHFETYWSRLDDLPTQARANWSFAKILHWEYEAVFGKDLRRMLEDWVKRPETAAFGPAPDRVPAESVPVFDGKRGVMANYLLNEVPEPDLLSVVEGILGAQGRPDVEPPLGIGWLAHYYVNRLNARAVGGLPPGPREQEVVGVVLGLWKKMPQEPEVKDHHAPRGKISLELYSLRESLPAAMAQAIEENIPQGRIEQYKTFLETRRRLMRSQSRNGK